MNLPVALWILMRSSKLGERATSCSPKNDEQFLSSCRLSALPTRTWTLRDFELGHPLGKGRFGRVFVARLKQPLTSSEGQGGFVVALKTLYKREVRENNVIKQVRREIEVQMNLR